MDLGHKYNSSAPFNDLSEKDLRTDIVSDFTKPHNFKGTGPVSARAHTACAMAYLGYIKALQGKSDGEFAIGTFPTPDGERYIASVEYTDTDVNTTIKEVAIWNPNANPNESNFKSIFIDEDDNLHNANYTEANHNILGVAMFAAMLPKIVEEDEAKRCVTTFSLDDLTSGEDIRIKTAYARTSLFCDNVYRRVLGQATADVNLSANLISGQLDPIVATTLETIDITPIVGTFNFKIETAETSATEPTDLASLRKLYGDPDEKWSETERSLIPSLESMRNVEVSKEAIEAVKLFRNGQKFNMPYNNFGFMGNAGSGKSTDALMIAAILNKPFVVLSISSNTDETNIKAGIYPVFSTQDNEGKLKDGFKGGSKLWSSVTSLEEIDIDPETAYEKLTGKHIDDVTSQDCMEWILRNGADKEDNKYVYVLSPLVKALTSGWVVEVQEVNLCNDPAVMPVINEFLERGTIRMDNGETLNRDSASIAIFTMNIDYAGCNQMNASVMSRLHWKVVKNTPSAIEMVKRLKKEILGTGLDSNIDETMLKNMAKTVIEMDQYCKEHGFDDGSCGYREFKNWFIATNLLNVDPYISANSTVISTATLDLEAQDELRTSVLEKHFSAPNMRSGNARRNRR